MYWVRIEKASIIDNCIKIQFDKMSLFLNIACSIIIPNVILGSYYFIVYLIILPQAKQNDRSNQIHICVDHHI